MESVCREGVESGGATGVEMRRLESGGSRLSRGGV